MVSACNVYEVINYPVACGGNSGRVRKIILCVILGFYRIGKNLFVNVFDSYLSVGIAGALVAGINDIVVNSVGFVRKLNNVSGITAVKFAVLLEEVIALA